MGLISSDALDSGPNLAQHGTKRDISTLCANPTLTAFCDISRVFNTQSLGNGAKPSFLLSPPALEKLKNTIFERLEDPEAEIEEVEPLLYLFLFGETFLNRGFIEEEIKSLEAKDTVGLLKEFWEIVCEGSRQKVCSKKFSLGDIVWQCRECQNDSTCVVCEDCYRNSDHGGHLQDHHLFFYQVTAESGGCCDCGDAEAWNPEGFCSRHKACEHSCDTSDMLLSDAIKAELSQDEWIMSDLPGGGSGILAQRARVILMKLVKMLCAHVSKQQNTVSLVCSKWDESVFDDGRVRHEAMMELTTVVRVALQLSNNNAAPNETTVDAVACALSRWQKVPIAFLSGSSASSPELAVGSGDFIKGMKLVSSSEIKKGENAFFRELVELLLELTSTSDALSRILTHCFLEEVPEGEIVDSDTNQSFKGTYLKALVMGYVLQPKRNMLPLRDVCLRQLVDGLFKAEFALVFSRNYESIYRKYLTQWPVAQEESGDCNLFSLSVQYLNRNKFVHYLVDNEGVLEVLFKCFKLLGEETREALLFERKKDDYDSEDEEEEVNRMRIHQLPYVLKSRKDHNIAIDVRYALQDHYASQILCTSKSKLLVDFCKLLGLMDSMSPLRRMRLAHVEREDTKWNSGLNLGLSFSVLFLFIRNWVTAAVRRDWTLSNNKHGFNCIEFLGEIIRYYYEFYTVCKNGQGWKSEAYDPDSGSFHAPLQRFLIMSISSTIRAFFSCSSLVLNTPINECNNWLLYFSILKKALGILFLSSAIENRSWVRNGNSVLRQNYVYRFSPFSSYSRDVDIEALRISVLKLSMEDFFSTMSQMVESKVVGALNPHDKQPKKVAIAGFWQLCYLIYMVAEAPTALQKSVNCEELTIEGKVISPREYEKERDFEWRREIIHVLSSTDATYNELLQVYVASVQNYTSYVPVDDEDDSVLDEGVEAYDAKEDTSEALLEKIIDKVADPVKGSKPKVFRIKEEVLVKECNLFYSRHSDVDREKLKARFVEKRDSLIKSKRVKFSESLGMFDFYMCHPAYETMRTTLLLNCYVVRLIVKVLENYVSNVEEASDEIFSFLAKSLETALLLVLFQLKQVSRFESFGFNSEEGEKYPVELKWRHREYEFSQSDEENSQLLRTEKELMEAFTLCPAAASSSVEAGEETKQSNSLISLLLKVFKLKKLGKLETIWLQGILKHIYKRRSCLTEAKQKKLRDMFSEFRLSSSSSKALKKKEIFKRRKLVAQQNAMRQIHEIERQFSLQNADELNSDTKVDKESNPDEVSHERSEEVCVICHSAPDEELGRFLSFCFEEPSPVVLDKAGKGIPCRTFCGHKAHSLCVIGFAGSSGAEGRLFQCPFCRSIQNHWEFSKEEECSSETLSLLRGISSQYSVFHNNASIVFSSVERLIKLIGMGAGSTVVESAIQKTQKELILNLNILFNLVQGRELEDSEVETNIPEILVLKKILVRKGENGASLERKFVLETLVYVLLNTISAGETPRCLQRSWLLLMCKEKSARDILSGVRENAAWINDRRNNVSDSAITVGKEIVAVLGEKLRDVISKDDPRDKDVIIDLSNSFTQLYTKVSGGEKCDDCGHSKHNMAICLLCGEVVRSGNYGVCQHSSRNATLRPNNSVGHCSAHTISLHSGGSVFFDLNAVSVIAMRENSGALMPSIYTDRNGESQESSSRTMPMYLDKERLDTVRVMLLTNSIIQAIYRNTERRFPPNWF